MKFAYPEICTPHAKMLCRLLEGEYIRLESPDWNDRSAEHDVIEDLFKQYGWPIYVVSGDAEKFDSAQRRWGEYSLDWRIIRLAKPRADLFIKQVHDCMAEKCDCAKKAAGGRQ